MTTLTICTTCRNAETRDTPVDTPTGESFLARVKSAANGSDNLRVRGVACLMGCSHGCNAAISSEGKMTYVLGRFDGTSSDADALVDYAEKHAESATGLVPFRSWHQGVKGHFISRIPPLEPENT